MKSSSRVLLFLLPALMALWGCKNAVPTPTSYATGGISDSSLRQVDDFDAGTTLVNPNLINAPAGGGGWSVTITDATASSTLNYVCGPGAPGASGTAGAMRLFGTLFEPGTSTTYPICTLNVSLHPTAPGTYDARLFRGVMFYYKTSNDDDTTSRSFGVALSNTSGNGTNFSNPLVSTGGEWKLVYNQFDLMQRPFWAIPLNPPTLSGANLLLMTNLSWSESRAQQYGTSTVDFWVDEVFFY